MLLFFKEPEHDDDFPWVQVYTTNTELDGIMMQANLESADIPVRLLSQVDSTRQLTIGELAVVKLFVPENYVHDAKEIIKVIEENDSEE